MQFLIRTRADSLSRSVAVFGSFGFERRARVCVSVEEVSHLVLQGVEAGESTAPSSIVTIPFQFDS